MKVLYFSYGANADDRMIKAIIGRLPEGQPAYIKGYELCVQKLKDIPKKPKEILRQEWDESFESYVVRRGKGKVYGTLWVITSEEREMIRRWELIPEGWYHDTNFVAFLEDGSKLRAVGEIIDNQPIDRVIEIKNYPKFLMKKDLICRIANKVSRAQE